MTKTPAPRVLVSACLLGQSCRYDGAHNHDFQLEKELRERGEEAVPFCPEEAAGMPTPRTPIYIEAESAAAVLDGRDRVVTENGEDVTPAVRRGAELTLAECRAHGIERAYLKERSPSCGVACTHVNAVPVPGPGVTAALLERAGIDIVGVAGRRVVEE